MGSDPIIVWFRRDLRMADNPALLHAAQDGSPVVPVYLADWEQGDEWAPGAAARWWLERSLARFTADLAFQGASLRAVPGDPQEVLPKLARDIGARQVVWNRLYEPRSRDLDGRVATALGREGVASRAFGAALLFEPDGHVSRTGRAFTQFTAFWRSCLGQPEPEGPLPRPAGLAQPDGIGPRVQPGATGGWEPRIKGASSWEPGEAGALARLDRFLDEGLAGYERARDVPGSEGVSRLSPHLHFGEVTARQVWHAVREAARTRGAARKGAAAGAASFLRQLGWREFAHYLLVHFPHMPGEPFRPEFADFPWEDDTEGFEAWKRGETG